MESSKCIHASSTWINISYFQPWQLLNNKQWSTYIVFPSFHTYVKLYNLWNILHRFLQCLVVTISTWNYDDQCLMLCCIISIIHFNQVLQKIMIMTRQRRGRSGMWVAGKRIWTMENISMYHTNNALRNQDPEFHRIS